MRKIVHPLMVVLTGPYRMVLLMLLFSALALQPVFGNSPPDKGSGGTIIKRDPCIIDPVVTNTNDAGPGSLRQAVADADDGSTITFESLVTGTITLAGTPVAIAKNLTIQGPGANVLTISGNYLSHIFDISNLAAVTIAGLNIVNGNERFEGGAISAFKSGNITITDCAFYNNSGQNGGAIYVHGNSLAKLRVTGSTFVGNSAVYEVSGLGGAISVACECTLINSTFTGNTARRLGGAIHMNGGDSIINCTITGNAVTQNGGGGGIYTSCCGSVVIINSIIAGNTADGTAPDISGYIPTAFNNIVGVASFSGITNGVNGNRVGTEENPVHPLLSALGDYGGSTQTMALLPGSPAINGGTNTSAPAADQRGIARPQQSITDIGAFESRGFILTASVGNNQAALVNTTFPSPLSLTVTSAYSEPVDGGLISFNPPQTGAGCSIDGGDSVTITSGVATSGTVNANATAGTYQVPASAGYLTVPVNFTLTNYDISPTTTSVTGSVNPCCKGSVVTFTSTVVSGANTPVVAGGVTFTQGNIVLADSVPLNANGQAAFTTDTLGAGAHTIVATYKLPRGLQPVPTLLLKL